MDRELVKALVPLVVDEIAGHCPAGRGRAAKRGVRALQEVSHETSFLGRRALPLRGDARDADARRQRHDLQAGDAGDDLFARFREHVASRLDLLPLSSAAGAAWRAHFSPVSCVLTSASVHDSQVAIPLMTMTGARVSYLYDLMDAAYDAAAIHDHSKALGHAPIIDRNFRAQHEAKAEWAKEVERMKLIHMPDPDDVIFNFRTLAERVNARLKDEF